jgi:lipopolysaccharide export LptBFGC system permease protein LptF
MTDITPIINAVIALIAIIITVVVIPYIRSKTTATQQAVIAAIVQTSVYGFEQLIQGDGMGAKRFINVIDDVQDKLEAKGIKFDYNAIKIQIEAAVLEMKTSQGK